MKRLAGYWHMPVLAFCYAAIGHDIATSPFEAWLSDQLWFLLFVGASVACLWQWVRPSQWASRWCVLLVAGSTLFRGFAVWWETEQRIAMWQGIIVFTLVARVYTGTRGRGWMLRSDS